MLTEKEIRAFNTYARNQALGYASIVNEIGDIKALLTTILAFQKMTVSKVTGLSAEQINAQAEVFFEEHRKAFDKLAKDRLESLLDEKGFLDLMDQM